MIIILAVFFPAYVRQVFSFPLHVSPFASPPPPPLTVPLPTHNAHSIQRVVMGFERQERQAREADSAALQFPICTSWARRRAAAAAALTTGTVFT